MSQFGLISQFCATGATCSPPSTSRRGGRFASYKLGGQVQIFRIAAAVLWFLFSCLSLWAQAALPPKDVTWQDPATGLEWTKQDNNASVDWNQAGLYCSRLRLEGHSDWRLPGIDELQAIYAPGDSSSDWHIKGGIQLSACCMWGSDNGKRREEAMYFGFLVGERHSELIHSTVPRALCVRKSSSKGQ